MRLIDADAFLKDILTAGIGKTIIEYSESDIGYMIRKRPTVDAVIPVRCRDCKHFCPCEGEEHKGVCDELVGLESCVYEDEFCSYGERMADDAVN